MTTESHTGPPSILAHDLNKYFPELLKFESTPEMEASELYRRIRPDVERIMNAVAVDSVLVPGTVVTGVLALSTPVATAPATDIQALAWNLERGIRLDGIID